MFQLHAKQHKNTHQTQPKTPTKNKNPTQNTNRNGSLPNQKNFSQLKLSLEDKGIYVKAC